jgi:hypothetical protein
MDLNSKELKAVWVLENAKTDRTMWMNDLELLYFVTSVIQFTKFYPTVPRHLICTHEVYQFLERLDILYFFNGIDLSILSESDQIDRKPFWACAKLKAIRKISAPFVMMDNDFFFKEKMIMDSDFEKYDIIVSHEENGAGYYITSDDPVFAKAGIANVYPKDLGGRAYNVSFLYIKDEDFAKRYAETGYDWMHKLSAINDNIHGGHMIFCEQKLLYDMKIAEDALCKLLIPDLFDCRRQSFRSSNGTQSGIHQMLDHLGPVKRNIEGSIHDYRRKRGEVLSVIKDYENLKHVFKATKMLDENKLKNSGKFYLSKKLNAYAKETPIKHSNEGKDFCVVYTLWEERNYLPYLKYSLMSLLISTDVKRESDILIFVTEDLYEVAINNLGNLISEECFVKMEDFKPYKYGVITHPRLTKYEHIMLLDSDLFFIGRRDIFIYIKDFYKQKDHEKSLFMIKDIHSAKEIFWGRKKDLCKTLSKEEYIPFFQKHCGESADQLLKAGNWWWLSPMVIYNNRYHFREKGYGDYVIDNLWHRQMCDETVFLMWAYRERYKILDTDTFIKVSDKYERDPRITLRAYHPIVGDNTTDYSNEEMIKQIEENYNTYVRLFEKRKQNESNTRKLDGTFFPQA